jgi:hypothetical protein
MTFGKNHLQVLDNKARATIANVACNYSAYKFFSDKQGIAAHMQRVLDRELSENLYASIDALQIETIELPYLFQVRTIPFVNNSYIPLPAAHCLLPSVLPASVPTALPLPGTWESEGATL